jgi:serine/threonine protein kinase
VARLRREARILASLNHPNSASIYGLEVLVDVDCLVLELVEGETLRGPLPIEQAVDYARQVAEGLQAAHEKGIIHRDLKPANVKVTPQGRVKVLDFGPAKNALGSDGKHDFSQVPIATGSDTVTDHILGTPGYMSPEQTLGQAVDERADIWAFGCLLYELLTGKRAFVRDTVLETTAAVLTREPDWQALSPQTPRIIRELLQRCLKKDPADRLSDIGEARHIVAKTNPVDGTGGGPLLLQRPLPVSASRPHCGSETVDDLAKALQDRLNIRSKRAGFIRTRNLEFHLQRARIAGGGIGQSIARARRRRFAQEFG